jgi:glucose-6-phosphate-specific signal transduction histidine kinase
LPERVEVAAYYIVSEALTNAAKHAHASVARVDVSAEDALLVLSIGDDGIGGADASRGSGLIGLRDRVETLGGTIALAVVGWSRSTSASGATSNADAVRLAQPISETLLRLRVLLGERWCRALDCPARPAA